MTEIITRQAYMEEKASYEQYYGQFVSEGLKHLVTQVFGKEALKGAYAADEHLNNIPLQRWDMLVSYVQNNPEIRQQLKDCGDFYSLAGGVCILKEAAREVIQEKEQTI